MNELKKYKKEIRKMFFISVKKDAEKWSRWEDYCFISPIYKTQTMVCRLVIYNFKGYYKQWRNSLVLEISQHPQNNIFICKYKFLIFPMDIKVWYYVNRIKNNIKNQVKNNENKKIVESLKDGLEVLQKNYVKEVRKEKLENINGNECIK